MHWYSVAAILYGISTILTTEQTADHQKWMTPNTSGKDTSSSAMAERLRELGDFNKARVNGGTNNHPLKDSHKCLRCR